MRPSEIATTIINGNIADARTAMTGREVSSKSRGALNAIEVIEELVDTYGWDWGPACDKVRRVLRNGKWAEYDEAAEAQYELEQQGG